MNQQYYYYYIYFKANIARAVIAKQNHFAVQLREKCDGVRRQPINNNKLFHMFSIILCGTWVHFEFIHLLLHSNHSLTKEWRKTFINVYFCHLWYYFVIFSLHSLSSSSHKFTRHHKLSSGWLIIRFILVVVCVVPHDSLE